MFSLPALSYNYNALEPFIDEETMHIHHDKHHQAYIDNLNKALEKYPDLQDKKLEELLLEDLPNDIKQAVINNGGGHFNHSFFWEIMSPKAKKEPTGELAGEINRTFGSIKNFQEEFTTKAISVFGSGWCWLLSTPKKNLIIKRHSFQNPPIVNGNIPLLGIDVWEHAYYLKYQNRRADYIKAWWNVVNWEKVVENFNASVN